MAKIINFLSELSAIKSHIKPCVSVDPKQLGDRQLFPRFPHPCSLTLHVPCYLLLFMTRCCWWLAEVSCQSSVWNMYHNLIVLGSDRTWLSLHIIDVNPSLESILWLIVNLRAFPSEMFIMLITLSKYDTLIMQIYTRREIVAIPER